MKTLPNGLPIHHYKLPNGLQIYIVENHSAPVFTYQTWFKVGARDEKLDPRLKATGLAHFFEHMMFRGTSNHGNGEFDKILSRNGVNNENATTWLDRTNYYQSLPADKLEVVVQLESDRMVNLVIDEKILDTERGAVLGEYKMGLDDPDSVAFDHLYGNAYSVHPYQFTTIGTEAEIRGFTKDDALYFYRKYYSPNNATILIAGDVDPEKTRALIEKYYGKYESQKIDFIKAPVEPVRTSEKRAEFKHPQLSAPKVLVAYVAPETRHPDHAALWVAQSVLTGGEGCLLHDAWVNSGIAVGSGGFLNQFQDPGLFVLVADLQDQKSPDELIQSLDRTIASMNRETIEEDLERARNQLLLEIYQNLETNNALTSFMGEFIVSAGDPLYGFELMEKVRAIQASDIERVVKTYLSPSRRTIVVGLPEEETAEVAS